MAYIHSHGAPGILKGTSTKGRMLFLKHVPQISGHAWIGRKNQSLGKHKKEHIV